MKLLSKCKFISEAKYMGVQLFQRGQSAPFVCLLDKSVHYWWVTTIYRKIFAVFVVFHSTANVFLWIMALSVSNISLAKCYSESFIVKSHFPLKTWKFSHTDVFLYTVYVYVCTKVIKTTFSLMDLKCAHHSLHNIYVHVHMYVHYKSPTT